MKYSWHFIHDVIDFFTFDFDVADSTSTDDDESELDQSSNMIDEQPDEVAAMANGATEQQIDGIGKWYYCLPKVTFLCAKSTQFVTINCWYFSFLL